MLWYSPIYFSKRETKMLNSEYTKNGIIYLSDVSAIY